MSNDEKSRRIAQIIHLEGMRKGFVQAIEQLQVNIDRVEQRMEELRELTADE